MRLLHIIDSLNTGGAERLLVDVINGLNGVEHHVLTISDQQELSGCLPPDVQISGIGFRSKKDIPQAIRKIRTYIRQHKIALVHSHLAMANVLARFGTPAEIPLINSLHSQNGMRLFFFQMVARDHHGKMVISFTTSSTCGVRSCPG
ncbi:MAG: glycosyltransferase [Chitinophagaceae bacterium]|nr:glycosyltransferase [Chitinophagaceae bacterium]